MSVGQRGQSVFAHPPLVIEVDERQLHLAQCDNLVRVRAKRTRLDVRSLAVEYAAAVVLVRQLLFYRRAANAFIFHC